MASRQPRAAQSPSRRDFIRNTALAGAALSFPTIVPSSVFGADGKTAPNSRLGIGFIGIGKQASGHLNHFLGRTDVQVIAVSDVHGGRLNRAKETADKKYAQLERKDYKGCDAYGDFHELLARKDIDAVVIGTPDHWHAAVALAAAQAGKDIYCEKPLTLTIGEAKSLLDGVRKYDRVFQTGSQQRSSGPFRRAVELIRDGRIGKVTAVNVGIGITSKPCDLPTEATPEGINWDMWLGQAPQRGYNDVLCRKETDTGKYPFNPGWRDYREYSGGYITDWGAHHFDITQWALGMDQSGPAEAHPPEKEDDKFGAKLIYRGSPVGDEITVTHVNTVYEGEVPDAKNGGKMKMSKETNGILFIGDKGKIFVSRSMIIGDPVSILEKPLTDDDTKHFKMPDHRDIWTDCIASRQRPNCDVEIGARSVTACHLVNLAYWNRRVLKWDAQKWEFPGDAEANGWRTRERRKGFELPQV